MPDASGRFKGISVPAIPWHEPQCDCDLGCAICMPEAFPQPASEDDEPASE